MLPISAIKPEIRKRCLTFAAVWAALWATHTVVSAAYADETKSATAGTEACLTCHGEDTGDSVIFADGSKKSVKVDRKGWMNSVHGGRLACTDCHREITGYPHRKDKSKDERDYQLARANTCQRCHYAHYTRALDGIHYQILQSGMREAPTCIDCHGSHEIKNPKSPRVEINNRCGTCHSDVNETFKKSVHGKALIEGNPDVPVCTDCHGAHAVTGPTAANFRINSYKLCANCHGDAERMQKYNLNTTVLATYLDDFHGSSNRLYAMGAGKPTRQIATCSDCHGVHNIMSFKAGGDSAEMKLAARERIVKTCRNCHAGVTPAFADAWLSHYEPTLKSAPLVWAVKWAYKVLIPMMVVGLILHILLHLWRLKTHR